MQDSRNSGAKSRRVSLSAHHEQIEQWVAQDRSDQWIADALGTSRSSVQAFRSRSGIRRHRRGRPQKNATEEVAPAKTASGGGEQADDDSNASGNDDGPGSVFEGVLDQGEEGYGLWLDPAVADDPLFRERFAGVSDVRVVVERGRIILEPAADRDGSQDTGSQDTDSVEPGAAAPTSNAFADLVQAADSADSGLNRAGSGSVNGGSPGRVKFFDANKGYGFLTLPEGGELFFHRSAIEGGEELEAGEFVVYESGSTQRGPAAKSVRAAG